jgi:hypothetical protein
MKRPAQATKATRMPFAGPNFSALVAALAAAFRGTFCGALFAPHAAADWNAS